MAQAMRVDAPKIGPPCSIRHERAHASRGEMVMGSDAPYEYGPPQCVHGAGLFQVFAVGVRDLGGRGVDGRAVAGVEMVDRAEVIDVGMGEQDGPHRFGP